MSSRCFRIASTSLLATAAILFFFRISTSFSRSSSEALAGIFTDGTCRKKTGTARYADVDELLTRTETQRILCPQTRLAWNGGLSGSRA